MGGFYVGECPRISPFLKNNGPGASVPLFLRNGELLGHSPIQKMENLRWFFSIFEVRGGNLKKNTFWKKWSVRIQRTKT